jgi:xanthine dehydrogenase YagR molybdenum-binding subunit
MIGRPVSRVDGPVKVTGRAAYAYEHGKDEPPLYGVIVTATIGHGRIREIDPADAERSPGVHAIITHENTPAQGARDESSPAPYWRARPTLASLISAITASRSHWWSPRRSSRPRRRLTLCA